MVTEKTPTVERREQIVQAALALSNEIGVERLSMRLIAERISLSPMGLYRHFASRAEILDALVGRVLANAVTEDLPDDWPSRLHLIAQRLLVAANAHPSAFTLVLARPYRAPEAVALMKIMYGVLGDAGVAADDLPRVERFISTALIGFAVAVASGAFWAGDSPDGPPMNPADERWSEELASNVNELIAAIKAGQH